MTMLLGPPIRMPMDASIHMSGATGRVSAECAMSARSGPRTASFGEDEDEIPPEFRHTGGPSGLGDFLIKGGGNSKQGKKKGKKKKGREAGEDLDFAMFLESGTHQAR